MKTMEELYKEIMSSEELAKEFAETVKDKDTLESFLKKYDCSASAEEAAAFLEAQTQETTGELDDSALESVGGGANIFKGIKNLLSNFNIGNGSNISVSVM